MKNTCFSRLTKPGIRACLAVGLFLFLSIFQTMLAQSGNAFNTGPYCLGQTVEFYGGPGSSWSWSGPGGFNSTAQNPTIPNADLAHAGTYDLSIGMPDGSIVYASTTVAVNAVVTLCHRQPTKTFSIALVPGAIDYQWFVDGDPNHASIVSGQTTTAIVVDLTVLSDGFHDISALANAASCNPPVTCLSIFLPPVLDISAGNGGPYCAGETIQLTSSPTGGVEPYSFSWSGPDGFVSTNQNPLIYNSTLSKSGTYDVLLTDANGCTWAASTTLSVGNAPSVLASNGSAPYCIGETVSLSATITGGTPAFSYNWRGPNNWTSSAENPQRTGALASMAGQYVVTVTDVTGCFGLDTIQVPINTPPTATASNGGAYCNGQTIQLNGGGGVSYQWTGPGGFSSGLPSPTRQNATVLMAGDYKVTVYDADGCSATTLTAVVVSGCSEICNDGIDNDGDGLIDCFDPDCENSLNLVSTDRILCEGETATLTATGGATWIWSTGETTNSIQADETGLFSVTATNAQGCTDDASYSIVVNPKPVPIVSAVGPFCEMDTLKLAASGGTTYNWAGPMNFTGHGPNPFVVNVTPSFSGIYNVTVTNQYACSATGFTSILVNPQPVGVDALGAAKTCAVPSPQLLGQSTTPGLSWTWTGPGGFVSVLQNPTVTLEGVYTARAFIPATGCAVVDSAVVQLDTTPITLTGLGGILTCADPEIRLNASASVENATYLWSNIGGFSSTERRPEVDQPGNYTVVATNPANGCTASMVVPVLTARELPTIAATGGNGNCLNGKIQLTATSGIVGAKFQWTGPGGFYSKQQNPLVAQPGTYNVIAINPATGCGSPATSVVVTIY